MSTTGALTNSGIIGLLSQPSGGPSATMSIAGALTNSGSLNIGNFYVGGPDEVTAASLDNTGSISLKAGAILDVTGALTNTGGLSISQAASVCTVGTLSNSGSISDNGTIDVTSGVAGFGTAGTVTGSVSDSFGNVEFASGQISTIAAGSSLSLNSGFIEDSTALGSNSALTGLSNVAGSLYLVSAPVSTTGALANSGLISIGAQSRRRLDSLSIAGALTNTGRLDIGCGEASSSVTANSFVNSGTVDLPAMRREPSTCRERRPTTARFRSPTTPRSLPERSTARGPSASPPTSTAPPIFSSNSSVSSGQTITETGKGTDALTLEEAQSFAATISGFGTGDTIDATNFVETGTTYNFVENSAMTGGTLTLTDTSSSLTANILMTGDYSNSDFTLAPDSGTGTLVKFV